MLLDDTAIVVTTFIRPRDLEICLKSIRKYYPTMTLMVADNGRPDPNQAKMIKSYAADHILLPFNSGLAMTRNRALENLSEYPFIMMLEDDMEFTEESIIEKFKIVIDGNADLGIVAGALEHDGITTLFANDISHDYKNNAFKVNPIDRPEWKETEGITWFYADYVYNFHIMRNVPDIRWDDNLKQCIEHFDFAVHIKEETDWRVAATPEVVCIHHEGSHTPEYLKYRRNFNTWRLFFEKRGIQFMDDRAEDRKKNFKTAEVMTYPEYHFRLLKAMNDATRGAQMDDGRLYKQINIFRR